MNIGCRIYKRNIWTDRRRIIMKVALVYTSTTPELIELVEKEVGAVLPSDTEVVSYEDPSILAEVRDAGYVTAPAAARLVGMLSLIHISEPTRH